MSVVVIRQLNKFWTLLANRHLERDTTPSHAEDLAHQECTVSWERGGRTSFPSPESSHYLLFDPPANERFLLRKL